MLIVLFCHVISTEKDIGGSEHLSYFEDFGFPGFTLIKFENLSRKNDFLGVIRV